MKSNFASIIFHFRMYFFPAMSILTVLIECQGRPKQLVYEIERLNQFVLGDFYFKIVHNFFLEFRFLEYKFVAISLNLLALCKMIPEVAVPIAFYAVTVDYKMSLTFPLHGKHGRFAQ